MLLNSFGQHRARHFDLLLARELSLIQREHSQNLITYQKFENSIRRTNNQSLNNNRTKPFIPFNNIYNEQTDSTDRFKLRINSSSNQKHRLSIGASNSNASQHPTITDQLDEFSDDSSSSISLRRRRYCTKGQRLPPIIKANISNQTRRENKNHHWMESFQQTNLPKETIKKPFKTLDEDILKPNLSESTPIQRQVRSFLETLPTYKDVRHGFDNFAPASLFSHHAPIAIR